MRSILIIQPAFIGDVVLATALIEKLHAFHPQAKIDFLLRKGNEGLLQNNPYISDILIIDKKKSKFSEWSRLLKIIRSKKYDVVVNTHRYLSSGILTAFSGARQTRGFKKNPLSFLFSKSFDHSVDPTIAVHEIERNHCLVQDITDKNPGLPKLYPSEKDEEMIGPLTTTPFVTMSPSSVWFTKRYPAEKWAELINRFDRKYKIYLLGGKADKAEIEKMLEACNNPGAVNLAGNLGFIPSAALMKRAEMNYVNDSAPMHFCSAVNAPVTAIFCSTVPGFGFSPLSKRSFVVETKDELSCRPCGMHGRKSCPKGHFKCGYNIATETLLATVNKDAAGK